MEFEFERRRLTKDDIRELIYREILEYHPQLLKDYMSGSEGSNFVYPRSEFLPTFGLWLLFTKWNVLYFFLPLNLCPIAYFWLAFHPCFDFFTCSAIGHLRQQFTYLEENSSRNGPVIPLERKHASLPRYVFSFFLYKSTVGNMLFFCSFFCYCMAFVKHMVEGLKQTFICSLLF